jgi:hypothetical protein
MAQPHTTAAKLLLRKRYPVRMADALSLQPRIATGEASAAEMQEYRRIIRALRTKFTNGQLSPANARRLGIE